MIEVKKYFYKNKYFIIASGILLLILIVFLLAGTNKNFKENMSEFRSDLLGGIKSAVKGIFRIEQNTTQNQNNPQNQETSSNSENSQNNATNENSSLNTTESTSSENNTTNQTTTSNQTSSGGGGSGGSSSGGGGGGSSNPVVTPYCTDLDNGLNYTNSSSIEYVLSGESSARTSSDVCLGSKVLSEQYCNGDTPSTQSYSCPANCFNGKCGELTCTDGDSGIDLTTKATTSNELESATDTCYNITDIKEYFCNADNTVNYTITPCSESCREGVCVPNCTYVKDKGNGDICNTVKVTGATTYSTQGTVTVAMWADEDFAERESDFQDLLLSYFNSMNQIYAQGINNFTGNGNHTLSFVLKNDEVYILNETFTNDTGYEGAINCGEAHWLLYNQVQTIESSKRADINVLVVGEPLYCYDGTWYGVLGVSNGAGTGQALVRILSTDTERNTASKPYSEEWWGSIIAHEVGHSIGIWYHTSQCLDVMCCSADDCCENFTNSYATDRGALGNGAGQYPADEWKAISDGVMQHIMEADKTDDTTYSSNYWDDSTLAGHYMDLNNFINWS